MGRRVAGCAGVLVALLLAALTTTVPASAASATPSPSAPAAPSTSPASPPSQPRTCPHAQVMVHTKNAEQVFTGLVVSVRAQPNGAKDPDRKVVTYTHMVTVDRIYKGDLRLPPDTDAVQVVTTTTASDRCSLGMLTVGARYVFFTSTQDGIVSASRSSGTALAGAALVAGVRRILGSGEDPTPPPPATATFSPVAHSAPARLSRLLAPGAALVLVGLLGLAVVGRMGRRAP